MPVMYITKLSVRCQNPVLEWRCQSGSFIFLEKIFVDIIILIANKTNGFEYFNLFIVGTEIFEQPWFALMSMLWSADRKFHSNTVSGIEMQIINVTRDELLTIL